MTSRVPFLLKDRALLYTPTPLTVNLLDCLPLPPASTATITPSAPTLACFPHPGQLGSWDVAECKHTAAARRAQWRHTSPGICGYGWAELVGQASRRCAEVVRWCRMSTMQWTRRQNICEGDAVRRAPACAEPPCFLSPLPAAMLHSLHMLCWFVRTTLLGA